MTDCVPTLFECINAPPTSKSQPTAGGTTSQERAPTDPYFYADVVLVNAKCGSRYLLGWDNSGVFTEFSPTFEGTVPGTEGDVANVTLSNVPALASPMLIEARVRKSSSGTKFKPLKAFAYHALAGVSIYVSQVEDLVAT